MNEVERLKMVKAMEFIARNVNDEGVFGRWLSLVVADGDIEYGDLSANKLDEDMGYYIENYAFKDLMCQFLKVMQAAAKNGGLYCDGVIAQL